MNYKKIFTYTITYLIISTAFIQTSISIGTVFEKPDSNNILNKKLKANPESILWFLKLHFELVNARLLTWREPEINPPEGGFPVLILFHGAVQHAWAWFSNSGKWGKEQTYFTDSALERGYFVIAVESKRPVWPGPRAWDAFSKNLSNNKDLQYVNSILKWLNNCKLSVNTSNVFCVGFSSGAFMCSRIGQTIGPKIKGLVIHSGANANTLKLTWKGPIFDLSKPLDISSDHPPSLVVHGNNDSIVKVECGLHLFNDLKRAGIDCELLISENGEHIWLNEFTDNILDWLDEHKV
jgi:predicted esterase